MLSAQEQVELEALETELNPQRQPAAPIRAPGDLNTPNIQLLTPEEEAELVALEQEFSPRQYQAPGQVEERGYLTQIGDAIDSYTGAPIRKAIGTLQDTNSLAQSVGAFTDQFGEDPSLAPTGKEIATKAGFSTENAQIKLSPREIEERERPFNGLKKVAPTNEVFSPAGVAGLAIDIGADWTNLLPFVNVGSIAGKLGVKAPRFLKGSAAAAEAAKEADKVTGIVNANTKFVKAGELAKVKDAKMSIVKAFRPDVAPDFQSIKNTLKENGISEDLLNSSHEFGEASIPARHERGVAEGPLGGSLLKKHEELHVAISNATDKKIKQIGKTDLIPDHETAGGFIQDSFDEGLDTFFKGIGETYDTALQMAPEMRLTRESEAELMKNIGKYERWALKRLEDTSGAEKIIDSATATKGQVNKATTEMLDILDSDIQAITPEEISQAKEVLRAVQIAKGAIQRTGGSAAQVRNIQKAIGKVAFESKKGATAVPSDIRKFQELYFSTQGALTDTIRSTLGNEFADELVANNKKMSALLSNRSEIAKEIQGKNGAKLFNGIILAGDTKKIKALKEIVSPEAWDKLRATYVNNYISRNSNGLVNYKTTRNTFNQLRKSGKIQQFMSMDEIQQLDDLLVAGERGGNAVLSTSGTGGSNAFRDMLSTAKNQIEGQVIVNLQKKSARSRAASMKPQAAPKRANLVEVKNTAESGKPSSKMSGLQRLKEKSPVSGKQASKGAQVNSSVERNERLEKYKQMRGIK